jgi:hypothetical protein
MRYVCALYTVFTLILPVVAHAAEARTVSRHASSPASPVVSVASRTVSVASVTAGEPVILFAIIREPAGDARSAHNFIIVTKADTSGAAQFELGSDIHPSSVIAIVDYDSGAYTLASPDGQPLRVRTFPPSALKKQNDEYRLLDVETRWLEALCVRPRKGAWYLFVTDGARLDRDGDSDGQLLVESASMKQLLGDDPSPKSFKGHDVVILINPLRMDVMATEVPQ